MKIFKDNIELVDLVVSDESYRYRTIMGENALTLTFSLNTFIEIPVGAYADFQDERYTLLVPQNFKKNDSRNFEYTLILESSKSLLGRYKFRDSSTKKLKFSATAKPIEHLEMLVWNLNQRDSGWSVGECIDSTEKLLSFNHTYCDEVLKMIAEAFNTEYEIVGKVISLKKVEYNKSNPLALSYGFGNGFKSGVKRDNFNQSKAIEVLYVQGGEKNIDSTAYGSSELLLPKNQTLVYQGRNYISDENGYSIKRADKPLSTYIEDSLDLSNIYPSRIGVISEVVTVNSEKNFYDIKDSSIPESLNYTDCLVKGETMTIIFQTGMLTGKEFDVSYNHASRKFEIIPQEIDGVTMPGSVFMPVVGDKYVVFGMSLPEAYVCDNTTKTGASWDMFLEAVKYFFDNEDPRFSFTGDLDGIWAKKDWLNIGGKIILGGFCAFTDEQFQNTPVLIRMVGIKDYINDPHYPQIELSNVTVGNTTSSQIKSIPTKDVLIEDSKKDSIRFAKRGFRDAKQTTEMLQSALLNFSSSISPLTVQTMQLIAGDETLQFEFVSGSTSTTSVAHNESYNSATKQFNSSAGVLQHKTLGVTTLSSSHAASELKWWNMTAFVSAVLDDSSKSYYLYAKVSKTANTGVFLLSETAIALESVAGYYHLLMGILNSEHDGDRTYSAMYGYSELTPGRLTVKKVVSPSGNTFFDLENEVIQGNIKFQSGASVESVISDAKSEAVQLASNDATTKANAAKDAAINTASADATNKANTAYANSQAYINSIKSDLQSQIDGNITSWFYDYEPTVSNVPASNWASDSVRDIHIGDLFYWTPKGWAYRYQKISGVYSWTKISDTDVTKALNDAATAQTIANGKRTTFSTQPTTPYLVADLWLNNGDLYSCVTARATGGFVASDWSKAVKYTDDTAVNNLRVGGRNYFLDSTTVRALSLTPAPYCMQSVNFPLNTEMTVSFYARYLSGSWSSLHTEFHGGNRSVNFDIGTDWTYCSVTMSTLTIGDWYLWLTGSTAVVEIKNIMIEVGNRASDWSPAPEDVAAGISSAQSTATNANGVANSAASVAATAQSTANTAVTSVNNIKVGGRNLLKDSFMVNGGVLSAGIRSNGGGISLTVDNSILYNGNPTLRVVGGYGFYMAHYPKIQSGVDYTVSMMIKADSAYSGNDIIPLHIQVPSGSHYYESIGAYDMQLTTGWKQIWKTFKSTADHDTDMTIYLYGYSASCNVAWIKLELGNKPTDWTEAPEDTQASINAAMAKAQEADYLKQAFSGSTEVNGGVVATNVMLMKDANGVITGGQSGLSTDNVLLFGGGTYQKAIESATNPSVIPVIIRKDGSWGFLGGKFRGTSNNKLIISLDNFKLNDSGDVDILGRLIPKISKHSLSGGGTTFNYTENSCNIRINRVDATPSKTVNLTFPYNNVADGTELSIVINNGRYDEFMHFAVTTTLTLNSNVIFLKPNGSASNQIIIPAGNVAIIRGVYNYDFYMNLGESSIQEVNPSGFMNSTPIFILSSLVISPI